MLKEWLNWLTTPCTDEAKKLGYLHEAIAIRERQKRNRKIWNPHLENSKRFILEASVQCPSKNQCVILGSGLLLDVPLDELCETFSEIQLVDMVHLREIRRITAGRTNIRLIECDVTGLAPTLLKGFDETLPEPAPPSGFFPQKPDLVVSLNLLSQLALTPGQRAIKSRRFDYEAVETWQQRIQQSHWDWVSTLGNTNCIISDVDRKGIDADGHVKWSEPMIQIGNCPEAQADWTWELASMKEAGGTEKIVAEVKGWILKGG